MIGCRCPCHDSFCPQAIEGMIKGRSTTLGRIAFAMIIEAKDITSEVVLFPQIKYETAMEIALHSAFEHLAFEFQP